MVTAVCSSGDAVQCVLGPAGSGKTYALAAAARAWQQAGFTVWGASVNGTAAEQLARATGIPTRTLASLLNRLDLADHPVLTDRHVIIVDEASTIGSRDLARLLRHTTAAGATVRLVGDPAQHSAIDAGGLFRALVDQHPERTPALTVLRRQTGDDMADLRLALTDYRQGRLAEAWQRLQDNARIVTADSPGELARCVVRRLVPRPHPPPRRPRDGGPVVDGGREPRRTPSAQQPGPSDVARRPHLVR